MPPAQSFGRVHDGAGGLLAVKAHIIKDAFGHIALDGVDQTYFNYLDLLFSELHRRYGERLWWTSMGEVAREIRTPQTSQASLPCSG